MPNMILSFDMRPIIEHLFEFLKNSRNVMRVKFIGIGTIEHPGCPAAAPPHAARLRALAGCEERRRSGSEDCLSRQRRRVPQLLRRSDERLARACPGALRRGSDRLPTAKDVSRETNGEKKCSVVVFVEC